MALNVGDATTRESADFTISLASATLGSPQPSSAGPEIDDIDDVLGRNAGQLLGNHFGGGARPRHRLGISYDDDSHAGSQQGPNFLGPVSR